MPRRWLCVVGMHYGSSVSENTPPLDGRGGGEESWRVLYQLLGGLRLWRRLATGRDGSGFLSGWELGRPVNRDADGRDGVSK